MVGEGGDEEGPESLGKAHGEAAGGLTVFRLLHGGTRTLVSHCHPWYEIGPSCGHRDKKADETT